MSKTLLVAALLLACVPAHAESERVVAIQPLGSVDPVVVQTVAERIETLFAARVTVLSDKPLPPAAYYAPRNRYRGSPLLDRLSAGAPAGVTKVLGLTARDVSVTRPPHYDWGVMGVAQLDRRAAVVSTYRLGRKGASRDVRVRRARDVAVHELGHTFGLAHCPAKRCVMNDARGRVSTVDACTGEFCGSCRERLGAALRPEPLARAERVQAGTDRTVAHVERPTARSRGSMRLARIH